MGECLQVPLLLLQHRCFATAWPLRIRSRQAVMPAGRFTKKFSDTITRAKMTDKQRNVSGISSRLTRIFPQVTDAKTEPVA